LIAYFDTSAIVPLLIQEAGTDRAQAQWVAADRVVTVRLAEVEARAALAQAQRTARLTAAQCEASASALLQLLEQAAFVDIDEELVSHAGQLAQTRALRAYDAVHLAAAISVQDDDLVVVAGDTALLAAAAGEGLSTSSTSPST